ncbi:hypothetical protein B9J09_04755 [Xylella fastidiosa subsp. pauca]|uniref:Uncharacterized protein n=2 Tax=Xylella fastidiosa TaxID=2371 RepID=A0ABC8ADH6_XYLFS|nr:hypothetical protein [Xylella fastidiosa]ALR06377.1 hypothetical protein XFHB_05450 [Xylella fastidiosa]ARO68434.1 hypothetical protein B9J09_04755 [Xylella fastidiosa subsp. pauca]AVI20562.1 hypothetical protein BCV75_04440 [Xylella fastidiosa]AVI22580.1 hypothetical protein BC375_04485 [Xylella fastidiosa]KIA57741.1 hypothetical protein RA12_08625 [Xylella fastidiosa]
MGVDVRRDDPLVSPSFLLAVQGSLAGSLAVVISPLESKRSKSAAAIFEMKIFQLCFKCGMQCGGYQFLVCDGQ